MENGGVTYQNDSAELMELNNLQEMLLENIGKYVVCELLVGLRSITVREGILREVGQDHFILEDPNTGDRTSCDLYSLKFMTTPGQGGRHPQKKDQEQYSPYGYGRPACGGGNTPGQTACWMRVD